MSDEARASEVDRFLSRVTVADGCWEHSGSLGSHGYPQATDGTKGWSGTAHRIGWKLLVGPIPPGLFVCHKCNNRRCVRPSHLYVGTHKQNMDDMARAGHTQRKLTREMVLTIRASSETHLALARRFGVTPRVIWAVRRGRTYRHVA